MNIALTKGQGSSAVYANYALWLRAEDPSVEFTELSVFTPDEAKAAMEKCDGIVFTGGPDIDPARYGKEEQRTYCGEIDTARDELELAVFDHAVALRMPILGICRGMQLINVALGGSLYTDIPSFVPSDTEHRRIGDNDAQHELIVTPGSMLMKMTGHLEGQVNSAHHQAVDKLSGDLTRSAISPDGIVEAIEWSTPQSRPFLFAVEWHPERMPYDSVFSLAIARHFLFEAASYEMLLKK